MLIDTSTLIAAMLPDHVHHGESHAWLSRAKAGAFSFFVSGHSLAEVYAVLTRLPRSPRIKSDEALQMIQENVSSIATMITLAADDYLAVIERFAQLNITGGAVYDGIIAKAAQLAEVDHLVTLNEFGPADQAGYPLRNRFRHPSQAGFRVFVDRREDESN